MRLHELEITAFGPFAETVRVDFDDLSVDGLFLLSGPTGAGKTSVLDAVCFALYGDVPGDRSTAKRLRSDMAVPGAAPRVVLRATLSGRLFRFTRSPGWERPKKRGSGTTTENAKVLVEERCGQEWVLLTNRMDEAGQLVTALLGMTMTQFCQVAMLPQGRFQQFLTAGSKDRQQLLQQLFATQRFEDIEKWLREHTRTLHRTSTRHHRSVSATLNRLLEAADVDVPEDWPDEAPDDLTGVASSGRLESWSAQVATEAHVEDETAQDAAGDATGAAEAARGRRVEAGRLHDLQSRRSAASETLAGLEAESQAHHKRTARLERARRAAPVRPLADLVAARTRQRDAAAEAAARASLKALGHLEEATLFDWVGQVDASRGLHGLDDTRVAEALSSARELRARAEALRPREQEQERRRAEIAGGVSEIERLQGAVRSSRRLVEELPEQISTLTTRLEAAREAKTRATTLAERLQEVDARLAARERLTQVQIAAAGARADLQECVDCCQSLKETWLDLREARLHGMAAEMARDLAVGECCPVCGSADHPAKAVPEPGSPSPDSEKQARARLDTEEATRVALEGKVRDLDLTEARVQQEAGTQPVEELRGQRDRLDADHRAATDAATGIAQLEPTLARLHQSLDRAHRELTDHSAALATVTTRVEAHRKATDEIATELADVLADTAHDTIAELCDDLDQAMHVYTEAEQQRARWHAAEEALTEATRMLDSWLADQGFASSAEALAASLSDADLEALADRVSVHVAQLTAARATLDEPEVAAAAHEPAPDLAALDADVARLTELAETAQARARVARSRALRLRRLHTDLVDALLAWAPVREAHATAAELTSFVEGKAHDNELRMRLSAYVLAWRLTQVVAAANERLQQMTDQRYTLEHTGRRGAGETRGGLSLLVRDEWSGDARDPATLSGGETFVVSLALALGLADVVTREAGGADLHTLFVDEGFGALDADTLDDVMDTLDSLRDGGRVVGVVSHVAEMRSRIPTQLVVAKGRTGSTVTVTHGGG